MVQQASKDVGVEHNGAKMVISSSLHLQTLDSHNHCQYLYFCGSLTSWNHELEP